MSEHVPAVPGKDLITNASCNLEMEQCESEGGSATNSFSVAQATQCHFQLSLSFIPFYVIHVQNFGC